MATHCVVKHDGPGTLKIDQVAVVLRRLLPEIDDLVVLDECWLKDRVPGVQELAARQPDRQWARAAALRTAIMASVSEFLGWADAMVDPRLKAEAEIIRLYLPDPRDWRRQTMTELARQLGVSRQKLYRLRDAALRQIAHLLLHQRWSTPDR